MPNYLIIGASSGIGKKLVEQLVDSGHKVLNVPDEIVSIDFLSDSLDGLVYCPVSINLMHFERIMPSDQVFHVDGGMSSLKV